MVRVAIQLYIIIIRRNLIGYQDNFKAFLGGNIFNPWNYKDYSLAQLCD